MQSYLHVRVLREGGGVVNTAMARAAACGIVMSQNRSLLIEYGGGVELGKEWARSLLRHTGFVKSKASTKSKMTMKHFEKLKEQFLKEITGINIVPASSWTMEVRGAKRVEVGGLDDKRQITGVFAASLAGDFFPSN